MVADEARMMAAGDEVFFFLNEVFLLVQGSLNGTHILAGF